MSRKVKVTPLSEVMEQNEITLDENGCDDLGINVEKSVLDFLTTQPNGGAYENEIIKAYEKLRFEKTVELAMDQLVNQGLAEFTICPETGEKLFKVHKNAVT